MSPDEYREKQLEAPLVEKWKPELSDNNIESTPKSLSRHFIG